MALFSRFSPQKKDEGKPGAIPQDILASVRVMGDEDTLQTSLSSARPADAPANLPIAPAPFSQSPFLQTSARAPLPTPPQAPAPTPHIPEPERQKSAPFFSAPIKTREKVDNLPPSVPSWRTMAEKKPSLRGKWPLFLAIGLIIFLVLAGGGYYYWQNEKAKQELSSQADPSLSGLSKPSAGASDIPTIKTLPYALDKPNYLSLDTETAEISGIKKNIDDVAARLVEGNVAEPIEFIITDKNNNPIAFSRFAYLLGISLPQELLREIEEPFSLYLSAESGRAVVGLELTLKDPATGNTLITQGESKLPRHFAPLLYAGTNITIPATVTFTPSPSRADVRIVRYHNFSLQPNVSFDYTVSGKQWFIGTSKETFRRLLEKAE